MRTGVDHDENFPVASWLCPPAQRPAVVALYRFARLADDLADEGDATADERQHALAQCRAWLNWATEPDPRQPPAPAGAHWAPIFQALSLQIHAHHWPTAPMHHLLDAFELDVQRTAQGHRYASVDALMDYCRLSANPVGRLLLHLFGVNDETSLRQSDAVCSALQLINFWQDIGIDWPRGRHYLPADALAQHGLTWTDFSPERPLDEALDRRCGQLVAELFQHATALMHQGAPLACRLPGRFGWELRWVVQGGLRVAEKAAVHGHQTWRHRPRLTATDALPLLWRVWRMGRHPGH